MTSKEKKTAVIREVITPMFKEAGYSTLGQTYYRMQGECCMLVNLQSSHFNSVVTGFTFWFHINVRPKEDTTKEWIKQWNAAASSDIHECLLLPDCGYLHPYHSALGYQIDGYRNYQPQDMDVEDIKTRIGGDFRDYILPQLDEIRTLPVWETKKKEWMERIETPRVRLLRYLSSAQMLADIPDSIPALQNSQHLIGVSSEEIRKNRELYLEIKALSEWPDDDKWAFILSSLE